MRISLNWLKELVDINSTPEEIAKTLTVAGFEVEAIEDLRQWADGVVVGKVIERQPHPNADKLSVCQVDVGADAPLNIVCGAANVRAEMFVPVATIGTKLPAIDLKIKRSKLRGVPSEGMICSLSELGLEKESEGIYPFPQPNLQPGQDVRPLLGLDDVILDLTTTANRADALSMVGVAREVAALTGAKLHLPAHPNLTVESTSAELRLKIEENRACPAYIGTMVERLTIAPSPDWLKRRLQAAGVRPINNVVDITNYILLEWGQPLHAFDREKLQQEGGKADLTLGVRFAHSDESLTTLDGQSRKLQKQNLLITANDRPVALAGVMGGEATEVHPGTQNIVLEAALFDPVVIRRSSRSQTLRTEASTRYERGVNQVELEIACQRAIALMQDLAGGEPVVQTIADARPDLSTDSTIELRLERIQQLLGPVQQGENIGEIAPSEVEQILTALGCKLEVTNQQPIVWRVTVPPYRHRDLEREIDLIEEVARLYGYDRFCDTLPAKTQPGYLPAAAQFKHKLREAFRGVGLTEVVHYSLVKPRDGAIVLANPLFSEYSALRTDLISGLIDAFEYNWTQTKTALNGVEIGKVFRGNGKFHETEAIGGIVGGDYFPLGRWTQTDKSSPIGWYEAKGMLESALGQLGIELEYRSEPSQSQLHPGRTASLWLGGQSIGLFGQLHPQLRQERDLPDEVYVFELDLQLLQAAHSSTGVKFKPYSTYPGVDRDLAFFASTQFSVAQIQAAMYRAGGSLLEQVELFDQYTGKNVPEDQRSLAFNLVYRSGDRTLTDQEVEPVHQKVRDTLVEQFDVTLRS